MKQKTNKGIILFVILVVILSAVFTWQALDKSSNEEKSTAENELEQNFENQGRVGVNIPSENLEGEVEK